MFVFYEHFDFLESDTVSLKICEKNKGTDEILPFYYYNIFNKTGDMVGKISIRIGNNFHSYYNGHIGYEVFREYQGHGYSYEAAKLVLQVAKAHQMTDIYLTCRVSNIPSIKTIKRLGAIKIEDAKIPPQCFFYYEGIEDSCIYQLSLAEIPMISLVSVTQDNYLDICNLQIAENQKGFVANPTRILASAYAMRHQNARVFGIVHEGIIVGVMMVKDLTEEPACYTPEQFLVDYRYQGRGYGKKAMALLLELLSKERRYNTIEICVKMEDIQAIGLYQKMGFADTGYIDPDNPDSYVLRYTF